jgi:polar amino acid transport system substrate-binding protein
MSQPALSPSLMHRPYKVFLWVFSLLSLGLLWGHGQETQAQSPWRLVSGNNFIPFTDEKLPRHGMLVEVVEEALTKAQQPFTLEYLPWKRGMEDVRSGKFDATFPYIDTPTRREEMLGSEPLYIVEQRLFFHPQKPITYQDPASLKGKLYCNPLGYTPSPALKALVEQGVIPQEQPKDMSSCLKLLNAGRVDFVTMDETTFISEARKVNIPVENFTMDPTVVSYNKQCLWVPKSHLQAAEIIQRFNQALKGLQDSGAYEEIVTRHLSAARQAG